MRKNETTGPGSPEFELNNAIRQGADWLVYVGMIVMVASVLSLVCNLTQKISASFFSFFIIFCQLLENFNLLISSSVNLSIMIKPFPLSFLYFIASVLSGTLFVFLGMKARQKKNWAFSSGIFLYLVDTLYILVYACFMQKVFSINPLLIRLGFHLLVLIFVFRGINANMELKKHQDHLELSGISHMEKNRIIENPMAGQETVGDEYEDGNV